MRSKPIYNDKQEIPTYRSHYNRLQFNILDEFECVSENPQVRLPSENAKKRSFIKQDMKQNRINQTTCHLQFHPFQSLFFSFYFQFYRYSSTPGSDTRQNLHRQKMENGIAMNSAAQPRDKRKHTDSGRELNKPMLHIR